MKSNKKGKHSKKIRNKNTTRKNKKRNHSKKTRNKNNTRKNEKKGGMFPGRASRVVGRVGRATAQALYKPNNQTKQFVGKLPNPVTQYGTNNIKGPNLSPVHPLLKFNNSLRMSNAKEAYLREIVPHSIIVKFGKDSRITKLIRFAMEHSNFLSGSRDQQTKLKRQVEKFFNGLNEEEKYKDDDGEKNKLAINSVMNLDLPVEKPSFFSKLRILEFLNNESIGGLRKIFAGDTSSDVIMETLKPVLDKVMSGLHITDCNSILEIIKNNVLGFSSQQSTHLSHEDTKICNELKTKFITEFSKNGYNIENFSKFSDDHKKEIVNTMWAIGGILLMNKFEQTIDDIGDTFEQNKEELENKLMEMEVEIIDKGFVNYSSRVAHHFFTDFVKEMEPNISKVREEDEDYTLLAKKLDKEYNDRHVSLIDLSIPSTIYSSIVKLLGDWDGKLDETIKRDEMKDLNLTKEAKDSLKYLTLLSCIDLRIGSLIEFYCYMTPQNKREIMCKEDIIKKLKMNHFRDGISDILKNVLLKTKDKVTEEFEQHVAHNVETYIKIHENDIYYRMT